MPAATPEPMRQPARTTTISRREAIERVTLLLGGTALIGGSALLTGCGDAAAQETVSVEGVGAFTPADVAFLEEIADTILPETGTPGAKAARTGAFMALMVTDTYTERNQQLFRDGMDTIETQCRATHGGGFVQVTPAQRLALLEASDREQHAYMASRAPGSPPHFFRMMKELALLGYFTSEIGYTQAMRYVESPGRFDPCVPHAPGDRTWAPHA